MRGDFTSSESNIPTSTTAEDMYGEGEDLDIEDLADFVTEPCLLEQYQINLIVSVFG
jgi:hypothetical protein